jgi:uncharacterized protein (DUF3084 family)
MLVKDLKATYTKEDMVKMFREVHKLRQENNALAKELASTRVELEQAKQDNADLTAQLDDMQGDLVRQMTAPVVVPSERRYA